MNEEQRNLILWIRAVEEADTDCDLLSESARDRASKRARPLDPETAPAETFLIGRAELLAETVRTREPGLEGALRATRVPPAWALALPGFVLGLCLEVLAPNPQINLLALPLLGIVVWNLLIFGVELLGLPTGRGGRLPVWLGGSLTQRRLRRAGWVKEGRSELRAAVVARFGALWLKEGAEAAALRWRLRFHLLSVGLAGGMVAGLYTAGFALAYQATWESTFLDAEAVHGLFRWLLAPSSWLLEGGLPSASQIAGIEAPGKVPAAPWIHRWALSLLCWVGLPRLGLALAYARSARRAETEAELILEDGYYDRLLGWRELGGKAAVVLPYSTRLGPSASPLLRELVFELLGNRTALRVTEPVAYGGDLAEVLGEEAAAVYVVVFNLAQSPEQEVHGRALETLVERILRAGRGRLLVLLDEEAYASRADESRLSERRRSWQRVAREAGLVAVPFAGSDHLSHATLDAAARELRNVGGDPP